MTDRNPLERDAGSVAPQRTTYRQGEAYGGPESYGPRSEPVSETTPGGGSPARVGLRSLILSGAAMLGVTALARLLGAPGWLSVMLGVAAFFGLLLYLRPERKTPALRVAESDGIDAQAVAETLGAAEGELAEVDRLAHGLLDRGLRTPLAEMTRAAREVLAHIAEDPDDLRRARKYVKVYIPSARAAVAKYAGLGKVDAETSQRFRNLVTEMTETGRRQLETLRLDEKTSLDVEIDVLAERLSAERSS